MLAADEIPAMPKQLVFSDSLLPTTKASAKITNSAPNEPYSRHDSALGAASGDRGVLAISMRERTLGCRRERRRRSGPAVMFLVR